MIEISPEIVTLVMIGGILLGILTGYPLAFIFGFLALLAGSLVWGPRVAEVVYTRFYSMITEYILLAIPLFIFMGVMLERSGIAEKLYEALYLWFGGLRGGLAIITVLIGTILAACVGIIAASITMLALVGLPSMVKRGYSKSLASGAVCAGGTLGILIPPSVMLVVYGPTAQISVGKLFMGAFMPGLLLSFLYCSYISIYCFLKPNSGPSVPSEERKVPIMKKLSILLYSVIPPIFIVMSVLGVIFFGIAPPTEAAGVGAFTATLLTIAFRKFNMRVLKECLLTTMRTSGFIFMIITMAVAFVSVFIGSGCGDVVTNFILNAPGGKWGIFAVVMLIVFILGMFMEWMGIVYITVPTITPIAISLGFDPVWFSIMVCLNLQMAFMTPPVAGAIFVCKGASPPELGISMGDIIRGVIPFILLVMVGLILCIVFPQIITWLPGLMIR